MFNWSRASFIYFSEAVHPEEKYFMLQWMIFEFCELHAMAQCAWECERYKLRGYQEFYFSCGNLPNEPPTCYTTDTKVTPLQIVTEVTTCVRGNTRFGCKGTAETNISLAVRSEAHKGQKSSVSRRKNKR
jgi:hypothetical protein